MINCECNHFTDFIVGFIDAPQYFYFNKVRSKFRRKLPNISLVAFILILLAITLMTFLLYTRIHRERFSRKKPKQEVILVPRAKDPKIMRVQKSLHIGSVPKKLRLEKFDFVEVRAPLKRREPMLFTKFMILVMDPYTMFEWGNDEYPAVLKAIVYHTRLYIIIFIQVFYMWAINAKHYTRFQTGIVMIWSYITVYPINLGIGYLVKYDVQ